MFYGFPTDGPDEPRIVVSPEEPFYVSGDSVNLSCQSEGFPVPSADWLFGGQILPSSHKGFLNLTNLQASHQGGVYTCMLLNSQTGKRRQKNVTITVYGMQNMGIILIKVYEGLHFSQCL